MIRLYWSCQRGMNGSVYPDGRALLDQPLVLLQAFATISDAYAKARNSDGS